MLSRFHDDFPWSRALTTYQLQKAVAIEMGRDVRHTVRYSDRAPLQILIHARGFAWTGASDTKRVRSDATSDTAYQVIYETETQGYFSELTYEIEVVIPSQRKDQLTVVFTDADGRQESSGE